MRYFKEIYRKNRALFLFYIFSGVFCSFLANFQARYFQKVVDGLTDRSISIGPILLYGALLAVGFLANYLDEYPARRLEHGIYLDFKLLALRKVSRVDYLEYQKLGAGKFIQRIETGAEAGKNILFEFWLRVIRELIPTVIFSVSFIWSLNRPITLMIVGGYAVVFLITNLLLKLLYDIKERILINEEKLNHFLVRGFLEMPIFRMARKFQSEIQKAETAKGEIVQSKVKMKMIHEAFFTIFALLVAVLDVGVLLYTWSNHSVSVGSAVALLSLLNNAYTPIAIFNVLYVQYKLDRSAFRRYEEFLSLQDDLQLENGKRLQNCQGKISVRNLCFCYGGRRIFNGLDLTIRPGEKVAFVGESGSGKSTLLKILAGLVKYETGSVTIDGSELKDLCLDSLYGHMSFLSQDSSVFEGTLEENITFGQEYPKAILEDVLEKVQLKSLYHTMENGLETRIGERGITLSGGERQRVALARLWFEKKEITILDEASSALDNLTEEAVMKEIMALLHGRTLIAVAHKLNSVKNFDRIVVLQNGEIMGEGTFEELLASNPYFKKLYQSDSRS